MLQSTFLTHLPGPDWIPWKIFEEQDNFLCHWLYLGEKRFTEPFFSDSIQHCTNLEQNRFPNQSFSTLLQMHQWSEEVQTIEPAAIIFHVSRCGSTLLSQLLSIDPENIVLSEAPLLDELLRLPFHKRWKTSVATSDDFFHAALQLYGRPRSRLEKNLFVKTDSWHLMFHQRVRKLYPQTPFLVLYRSPLEVIRSQKKLRGMQSVPGTIEAEVFGFSEHDISFDLDLYMSRVLEKYYTTILHMMEHDPNCLVVDYAEGMDQALDKLIKLTGLQLSPVSLEKMESRKKFHSKSPSQIFEPEPLLQDVPSFLEKSSGLYQQIIAKQKAAVTQQ
ncbi:MAG: hypothetical protein ACJ75B_15840 [Flavisolibacter sp.]